MQAKRLNLDAGLYIIATPLGNARDITLRALDVLTSADVILCEDTRLSGRLTQLYAIDTKRIAYHEHNAAALRPKILARLAAGEAVALISDAGTPLISDPGMPLVRAARQAGHQVTAVPGPSAPIAALSISGLPTDRFSFAGFLPPKQAARRRALRDLGTIPATLVLFESAKRLTALLGDIEHELGPRQVCVARELTKKFEDVQSGTAAQLAAHFTQSPPRGEVTLLIEGGGLPEADGADIDAMLRDALQNMSRRDAVQAVAEMTGRPRKSVYAQALKLDAAAPSPDTSNKKDKNHDPAAPISKKP